MLNVESKGDFSLLEINVLNILRLKEVLVCWKVIIIWGILIIKLILNLIVDKYILMYLIFD